MPNPEFFAANRRRFAESLPEGAAAVLYSGMTPGRPDRNFYYLTGISQTNTVLLMDGGADSLFMDPYDAMFERWNGHRLSPAEAEVLSGIGCARPMSEFDGAMDGVMKAKELLYIEPCPEFKAAPTPGQFFYNRLAAKFPGVTCRNAAEAIVKQRVIKQPYELECMRAAARVTAEGITAMMKAVRPGIGEYILEAEFNRTTAQRGIRRNAFDPIIAADKSALCLHYGEPYNTVGADSIVLVDVGSEWEKYAIDISRAFPVKRFDSRQRAIYEIALAAQKAAIAAIKPGAAFAAVDEVWRGAVYEGLKELKLLERRDELSKYVWHGAMHGVGLDTHDPGAGDTALREGMASAVEIGIYIEEWGFGLRVEDTVAVTADGCEVLSACMPKEIDEIYAILDSGAL